MNINKIKFSIVLILITQFFYFKSFSQTCTISGTSDGINAPFDICGDGSTTKYTSYAVIYLGGTEVCYGTLTNIQYYVTWAYMTPNVPIKIYLTTTASNNWGTSPSTYSSILSGATAVYSNTAAAFPSTGYQTFNFSTSFTFTTGNLVVITETNWGAIPACGTAPVFGYGTRSKSDQYWYGTSASNRNSSTGTIDKYRPGYKLAGSFLPVELTDFQANLFENEIKLKWSTLSEKNNKYFVIERSSDGENFEPIDKINGAGNSLELINYNDVDHNPVNGINYYRLTQVDIDGSFKYSEIISVDVNKDISHVENIRPNPTSNNINFDFYSHLNGNIHIQIIDFTGKTVKDIIKKTEGETTKLDINMEELSNGLYSLLVSFDKTGYTSIHKILKE